MAAGKHVLCEKPMAITPRQADEMVAAAREAGVTLGIVYQNRWRPEIATMKQMLEHDVIGEIYRTLLVHPDYRSQPYYDQTEWRGTWDQEGGGVLFNQSVHMLDVLQWVGGMPTSVTGVARTQAHDIEVEDTASAIIEYGNGAQGMIYCSTVQAPGDFQLEIWGDKGGLVAGDNRLTHYRLAQSLKEFNASAEPFRRPEFFTEPVEIEVRDPRHGDAVEDFIQAVAEGRPSSVTGEEGAKSLELATAIILSSCRRRTVDLPVDRDAYDGLLEELKRQGRLP